MADLLLKNVDQALLRTLEQRAKRLGITVEAVAVRALTIPLGSEDASFGREEGDAFQAFLEGSDENEDRDGPKPRVDGSPVSNTQHDRAVNVPRSEVSSLGERQAALASDYPDEYVVFLGEQIVVHTANRDEAHRRYEAAFSAPGGLVPIVVAPGALRRLGPPVLRGRASAGRGSKR